jgi:hypothetical protein
MRPVEVAALAFDDMVDEGARDPVRVAELEHDVLEDAQRLEAAGHVPGERGRQRRGAVVRRVALEDTVDVRPVHLVVALGAVEHRLEGSAVQPGGQVEQRARDAGDRKTVERGHLLSGQCERAVDPNAGPAGAPNPTGHGDVDH